MLKYIQPIIQKSEVGNAISCNYQFTQQTMTLKPNEGDQQAARKHHTEKQNVPSTYF